MNVHADLSSCHRSNVHFLMMCHDCRILTDTESAFKNLNMCRCRFTANEPVPESASVPFRFDQFRLLIKAQIVIIIIIIV